MGSDMRFKHGCEVSRSETNGHHEDKAKRSSHELIYFETARGQGQPHAIVLRCCMI